MQKFDRESALIVLLLISSTLVVQQVSENVELRESLSASRHSLLTIEALESNMSESHATIDKLQQRLESSTPLLNRPTVEELMAFLSSDLTDEKPYSSDYLCFDYASDLKHSATVAGWNISVALVNFEGLHYNGSKAGGGHVINGACLADGSWVWIEPQSDSFYRDLETLIAHTFRLAYVKIHRYGVIW